MHGDFLYSAAAEIRAWLRSCSITYVACARIARAKFQFVDNATELCLEGFPRCGNSFAVSLLNRAAPGLRVAHHTHSVANVKKALKWGIPVFITIREPLDALVSYVVRRNVIRGANTHKQIVFGSIDYARFYEYVAQNKDNLVTMDFFEITQKPSHFLASVQNLTGGRLLAPPKEKMKPLVDASVRCIHDHEKSLGYETLSSSVPSQERRRYGAGVRKFILEHHHSRIEYLSKLYGSFTDRCKG